MSRPVPITMLYLTFISNGSWTLFTWRGHSNGDAVRMSLANLIAQSTCSTPSSPQKARRAGAMIVFVCYDDTQNPESTTLPSPCTPPVHSDLPRSRGFPQFERCTANTWPSPCCWIPQSPNRHRRWNVAKNNNVSLQAAKYPVRCCCETLRDQIHTCSVASVLSRRRHHVLEGISLSGCRRDIRGRDWGCTEAVNPSS
jgi:hypothetical protein